MGSNPLSPTRPRMDTRNSGAGCQVKFEPVFVRGHAVAIASEADVHRMEAERTAVVHGMSNWSRRASAKRFLVSSSLTPCSSLM